MTAERGKAPVPVVIVRILKPHLRSPAVVPLHELRFVAHPAHDFESRVQAAPHRSIAHRRDPLPASHLKPEPEPVVAADPHPIDEPLIQGVHRQHVFPVEEIRPEVDLVHIGLEGKARRRSLSDEMPVDIELIPVVRRDPDNRRFPTQSLEPRPVQHMEILRKLCGNLLRLKLAVKYIRGYGIRIFRQGDERRLFLLFHVTHSFLRPLYCFLFPDVPLPAVFEGQHCSVFVPPRLRHAEHNVLFDPVLPVLHRREMDEALPLQVHSHEELPLVIAHAPAVHQHGISAVPEKDLRTSRVLMASPVVHGVHERRQFGAFPGSV